MAVVPEPAAAEPTVPEPAAARPAVPESVVIAERGIGPYRQYRIPAIAVVSAPPPAAISTPPVTHAPATVPPAPATPASSPSPSSTLICVYDARLNLDDLPAPIDLVSRRSLDGGRTWGEPYLVRTGTGFEGFGDPSLLADPRTGRLLLFHSATVYAGFFESSDSLDDSNPHTQHVDLAASLDGGATWSFRRLTTMLRESGNKFFDGERIAGMFAASGSGCALDGGPHAGRLVQPFVLRVGGRIRVACALSDDGGETWRFGAPVPVDAPAATDTASKPELNESSVTALSDGRLVLHSRGVGARWQAFSDDGGETFSPATPVASLIDSGTNGSVLRVDTESGPVLFASHTVDPDLRCRAAISRSDDGGASWREVQIITPGAAGYTQLVALPEGRAGVIYEVAGYQRIEFESFALADLVQVAPISATLHAPAAAASDPVIAPSVAATPNPAAASSVAATPNPAAPPSVAAAPRKPDTVSNPAAATGWWRVHVDRCVLDVVLRSITPPPPPQGAGETYTIPLADYADVPTTVFKEIGLPRSTSEQILYTREALRSGAIAPGIHAGEALTFHARLRNTTDKSVAARWLEEERVLAPGEAWVRRDLHAILDEPLSNTAAAIALVPRPEITGPRGE